MNAFTPAWYISLIVAEKSNLWELLSSDSITKDEYETTVESLNRIERTIRDFVEFTDKLAKKDKE